MKLIKCKKCGDNMNCLGNVSGITYTSYPPQWDDVYVCDLCKTKETIREHGEIYDPTGGRNLGEYTENINLIEDCCIKNLDKAIYKSRAYWVCPVCGRDVSLLLILLSERGIKSFQKRKKNKINYAKNR